MTAATTNSASGVALDKPASGRLEPLRPMPIRDVTRAMQEYQEGLHAILAENDWQTFVDRDGRERRFVKRPGWRKVATWFGLDLHVITTMIDRLGLRTCPNCQHTFADPGVDGDPLRALVKARAVAPNGRVAEDVGACSISERRFSKPEHDLVATATTRAINRATSNLVGMGDLSAEEMADETEPALPDWAQMITAETLATMHGKLGAVLGGEQRSEAVLRTIAGRYGGVPVVLARFVDGLHAMLMPVRAANTTTTPTE